MFKAGFLRPYIGARYRFGRIPEAVQRLSEGKIADKAVADVADA